MKPQESIFGEFDQKFEEENNCTTKQEHISKSNSYLCTKKQNNNFINNRKCSQHESYQKRRNLSETFWINNCSQRKFSPRCTNNLKTTLGQGQFYNRQSQQINDDFHKSKSIDHRSFDGQKKEKLEVLHIEDLFNRKKYEDNRQQHIAQAKRTGSNSKSISVTFNPTNLKNTAVPSIDESMVDLIQRRDHPISNEHKSNIIIKKSIVESGEERTINQANKDILKGLILERIKKVREVNPKFELSFSKLKEQVTEVASNFQVLNDIVAPTAKTSQFQNQIEEICSDYMSQVRKRENQKKMLIEAESVKSTTSKYHKDFDKDQAEYYEKYDRVFVKDMMNNEEQMNSFMNYKDRIETEKVELNKLLIEHSNIQKKINNLQSHILDANPSRRIKHYMDTKEYLNKSNITRLNSNTSMDHRDANNIKLLNVADSYWGNLSSGLLEMNTKTKGEIGKIRKALSVSKKNYDLLKYKLKNMNLYVLKNPELSNMKNYFLVEAILNLIKINEKPSLNDFWEGFDLKEKEFLMSSAELKLSWENFKSLSGKKNFKKTSQKQSKYCTLKEAIASTDDLFRVEAKVTAVALIKAFTQEKVPPSGQSSNKSPKKKNGSLSELFHGANLQKKVQKKNESFNMKYGGVTNSSIELIELLNKEVRDSERNVNF